MELSFKYRIYLNRLQSETLTEIFKFCNNLYNCALEERISYYKKYKKSINLKTQSSYLPEIKTIFPEQTKIIYAQSLQFKLLFLAQKNK